MAEWTGRRQRVSNLLWNYVAAVVLVLVGLAVFFFAPERFFEAAETTVFSRGLVAGFFVFVGAVVVAYSEMELMARRYAVREEGVASEFEFIIRRETRAPFQKVTDITVSEGIFDRYLAGDTGTIELHTAGQGSTRAEVRLKNVADVQTVADTIRSML